MEEMRDKKAIKHSRNNKMAIVSSSLSLIILTVNGLSFPIRKHRLAKYIKNKIQLYAVYKRLALNLRLKVKGLKKLFYIKSYQKSRSGDTNIR